MVEYGVMDTLDEKEWLKVFKALANINRIKIVKYLFPDGIHAVGMIATHIRLPLKSTSKHLIKLENLGILESEGRDGRVFYFVNPKLRPSVRRILEDTAR